MLLLTRETVTRASRTMLPAYVVLCVAFGAVYVIDPQGRLGRAPSTTFQRDYMPLEAWGGVLLALAVLMLAAMATKRRYLFAYALCCCGLTWFIWGLTLAGSIPRTDNTSYLAPVPPWFFMTCCIASLRSLLAQEA